MSSPDTERARPRVSAVVLAFGAEPLLAECVTALLRSARVTIDVVLVDNGCTTAGAVDQFDEEPGVIVVRPGANTGFAGGCNLGARRASGEILAFVNSDAVVAPGAIAALAGALEDARVGIVTGSLRLMDRPDVINSAGNPVHYLGLSWAGGLGEPATSYAEPRDVASATGAVMALRRATWTALGGFYEPMFAYCEDTELSLRCWQRGWSVLYVPDAVALHSYEFHRNPLKMYLLERNRLLVVLTLYERRTLALLALPLVGLELAVLAVALKQGWGRQKVRGWWWLLTHSRVVRRRRAQVQGERLRDDGYVVPLLTATFTPGAESGIATPRTLSLLSSWYWRLVRRRIREV